METSGKKIPNSKKYLSPHDAEIKKKLRQERRLAARKIRRKQLGKGQNVKEKTVFMCQTSPKEGKPSSGSTQRTRLQRFLSRAQELFEAHGGEFIIYSRFPNEKKFSSTVYIIGPNAAEFNKKELCKTIEIHWHRQTQAMQEHRALDLSENENSLNEDKPSYNEEEPSNNRDEPSYDEEEPFLESASATSPANPGNQSTVDQTSFAAWCPSPAHSEVFTLSSFSPQSMPAGIPVPSVTAETTPLATSAETTSLATTVDTTALATIFGTTPGASAGGTTGASACGTTPRATTYRTARQMSAAETIPVTTTSGTVPLATNSGTKPRATISGTTPGAAAAGTTSRASTTGTTPRALILRTTPRTPGGKFSLASTAGTFPISTAAETIPLATSAAGFAVPSGVAALGVTNAFVQMPIVFSSRPSDWATQFPLGTIVIQGVPIGETSME